MKPTITLSELKKILIDARDFDIYVPISDENSLYCFNNELKCYDSENEICDIADDIAEYISHILEHVRICDNGADVTDFDDLVVEFNEFRKIINRRILATYDL